MTSNRSIYSLVDPFTDKVMYVGITSNCLNRRLYEHIRAAKKNKPKTHKSNWINSLILSGKKPKINLLEACEDNHKQREQYWIDKYDNLLNTNKAGAGISSHRINGLPEDIMKLLGKINDVEIARIVGITRKAVGYYRYKFNIPAANDKSKMKPPPKMGGHNFIELSKDIINKLGTMPDYKLAEIANVSKKRIIRERHKLGIKSYAEITGNSGKFHKGMAHPRWK